MPSLPMPSLPMPPSLAMPPSLPMPIAARPLLSPRAQSPAIPSSRLSPPCSPRPGGAAPHRRRLATALLAVAALAAAPAPAEAEVHPFYEQRLSAGVVALSQGAHAAAEEELRLAAFGLLDEPARLVVALAYLALADRAAGDAPGLDATLQRLLAVERSFAVWAAADLPATARAEVEATLAERVPEAGLAAVPTFSAIARRRAAERIAALGPAERRRELLARTAADPDAAVWQVMLGELELAAGDTAQAAARAQRALASQPSPAETLAARCLRGTALARSGSCAAAVADLEACPSTRREPQLAQQLLQCHARLGQWRQAKAFADSLPPTLKSRRDVARLVRQVDNEVRRLPAPPPAAAEPAPIATVPQATPESVDTDEPAEVASPGTAAAAPPPAATATRPAATPPAATPPPAATVVRPNAAPPPATTPPPAAPAALPAADQARLARARVLMGEAKRAGELAEAMELAAAVADAHPSSAEAQRLAGEIAYRASRWTQAVTYLRRGGISSAPPELVFYLAVALWESDERQEAARVLETALPRLPRNAFVDGYAERILGRPR